MPSMSNDFSGVANKAEDDKLPAHLQDNFKNKVESSYEEMKQKQASLLSTDELQNRAKAVVERFQPHIEAFNDLFAFGGCDTRFKLDIEGENNTCVTFSDGKHTPMRMEASPDGLFEDPFHSYQRFTESNIDEYVESVIKNAFVRDTDKFKIGYAFYKKQQESGQLSPPISPDSLCYDLAEESIEMAKPQIHRQHLIERISGPYADEIEKINEQIEAAGFVAPIKIEQEQSSISRGMYLSSGTDLKFSIRDRVFLTVEADPDDKFEDGYKIIRHYADPHGGSDGRQRTEKCSLNEVLEEIDYLLENKVLNAQEQLDVGYVASTGKTSYTPLRPTVGPEDAFYEPPEKSPSPPVLPRHLTGLCPD